MSSSSSPCAACKFLRRKCTQECVFAPYFPPDNPKRFECVHRVFGASNVAKLLNELSAAQRDDAVKSLAYEAEARLRDPVYGCVGFISVLQQRLRQIQAELVNAKKELAQYLTPQAMQCLMNNPPGAFVQQLHQHPQPIFPPNYNVQPVLAAHGGGNLVIRDPQQQEFLEAQQLAAAAAAAREQQAMLRSLEQQQELMRFNSGGGFDAAAAMNAGGVGSSSGIGGGFGGPSEMNPSLALGNFENVGNYQMQQQQQTPVEAQLLLSPQQQQSESEDGRSAAPASS